jgi:hypothetical protein
VTSEQLHLLLFGTVNGLQHNGISAARTQAVDGCPA